MMFVNKIKNTTSYLTPFIIYTNIAFYYANGIFSRVSAAKALKWDAGTAYD